MTTYRDSAYASSAYGGDMFDTLSSDIVSIWNFDGDATDSFASNDLTAVNSPTYTTGKLDQAVVLNGTTQYLTRATSAAYSGNIFTWTTWVYLSSLPSSGIVVAVSKWGGSGDEYAISYDGDADQFRFTVQEDGGSAIDAFFTSLTPEAETWYFLACRYSSLTLSIDVNNIGAETQACSANPPASNSAVYVGCLVPTFFHWPGRVDQTIRWTRSLTDAELTNIYNGGAGLRFPY